MIPAAQPAARPLSEVRLRLLSFSTGDMLQQALKPAFVAADFNASVSSAGFGRVVEQLLEPAAELHDVVVIQVDAGGLYKRDWNQSGAIAERSLEDQVGVFLTALEAFASAPGNQVLINNLLQPVSPSVGFLDIFHTDGAAYLTSLFNRRLGETAQRCNDVTIIDTDLAMAHIAPLKRTDPKLWFYGRIPYSTDANRALATAFAQAYAARKAKPVKVLALDLDNTLWRGLYGEDGVQGVECGDDFPGNAFKGFQEECLRLKGQGMLLTILSKNDEDALRVFDQHPGMSLRHDDFIAHRINWEPKAQNIRSLAEELQLGLDSFVFVDDSPHEREAMRRLAPEVHVLELPEDPAVRIDYLRNFRPLWPLRLTEEDRVRSELYAVQSKGRALQSQVASVDEYLASLDQRLQVEAVSSATLPRVAQMHARTNQFNLTTLRLGEADLAAMMDDPGAYRVLLGRVADRFGDHGIVICACARISGTDAEVATFLMSCRVIGRQVEHAFLGALLDNLTEAGVERVEATFIPTQRNTPASKFYEEAGLALQGSHETEAGMESRWVWTKDTHPLPNSDFVAPEISA